MGSRKDRTEGQDKQVNRTDDRLYDTDNPITSGSPSFHNISIEVKQHADVDEEQQQEQQQQAQQQERQHTPQHILKFAEYHRLPVNEAIAMESLIDPNIYGKLQSLFKGTDLELSPTNDHTDNHSSSIPETRPSNMIRSSSDSPVKSKQESHPKIRPRHNSYSNSLSEPKGPKDKQQKLDNSIDGNGELITYNDPSVTQEGTLSSVVPFSPNDITFTTTTTTPTTTLLSSTLSNTTLINSFKEEPNIKQTSDLTKPTDNNSTSQQSGTDGTTKQRKRKYGPPKGGVCHVCHKAIKRDLVRHLRTHEEIGRFKCSYPRNHCSHKTGFFNRQYDFKKHLLHTHFKFHDEKAKKLHKLNDKLWYDGICGCGLEFVANVWLDDHILTKDPLKLCPQLKKLLEENEQHVEKYGGPGGNHRSQDGHRDDNGVNLSHGHDDGHRNGDEYDEDEDDDEEDDDDDEDDENESEDDEDEEGGNDGVVRGEND